MRVKCALTKKGSRRASMWVATKPKQSKISFFCFRTKVLITLLRVQNFLEDSHVFFRKGKRAILNLESRLEGNTLVCQI